MARRRGPKTPRVSVSYEDAPDEVRSLAKKLIEDSFEFLAQAKIGYLIRQGKWSRRGNTVFAAIRRPGPEERHFHGLDYILVVNHGIWYTVPEKTKEAIIDEQFCLCQIDDKTGKYGIGAPDVTANNKNVGRFGAWRTEYDLMVKAIQRGTVRVAQTELPVDEAAATVENQGESVNDGAENVDDGSNPWDQELPPAVNS